MGVPIRRSRGYRWEKQVIQMLLKRGCIAVRLGQPHQPDVIARCKEHSYVIECKSKFDDDGSPVYVSGDQLDTCREFAFLLYGKTKVVVAAKIGRRRVYKIIPDNVTSVRICSDGYSEPILDDIF